MVSAPQGSGAVAIYPPPPSIIPQMGNFKLFLADIYYLVFVHIHTDGWMFCCLYVGWFYRCLMPCWLVGWLVGWFVSCLGGYMVGLMPIG